jgi:hypothetical protein
MSSLQQQLSTIKSNERILKIGPNLPQPTILLDQYTARNASIDIIYTMGLMSFYNLSKS